MTPIYVSFHTTDPGYSAESVELGKTLDTWGLPADLVGVPPFGNWVEACAYKPIFLQAMRKKHGNRPLVWLDADARVRMYPDLLLKMPPTVDFAAHWKKDPGIRSQESGVSSQKPPPSALTPDSCPLTPGSPELLSGTLYFGATDAADRLLVQWAAGCIAQPDEWDQKVLQTIVDTQINKTEMAGEGGRPATPPKNPLVVYKLPAPYCLIFDTMRDHGPPVIEQMQASRRLRR